MNQPTKIVYFIDTFSRAGAETFLLDLVNNLDQTKYEIHVAAVIAGGALESDFENSGVKVKVFQKKTKLALSLFVDLYWYLKDIKPQIVHTNLFASDTYGRLAAKMAKVPFIISTEHNRYLNEGWLKKKIRRFLSIFTHVIVAVTEGVKEYAINKENYKAEKVTVINYGIHLDKFKFRGIQIINTEQKINAIIVGRLVSQKGHKYLLQAMPEIITKYPNLVLNIVGHGELDQELREMVTDLGLDNNIKFWGEQSQMDQVLPQMDFMILPSLYEGMGIVILEAKSVGLPVLASDIPGPNNVITDSVDGLLFKPQDPKAIFQAVDRLLNDIKLQESLIIKSYEQVKQGFSAVQMAQNYSQLYIKLLNKNKA